MVCGGAIFSLLRCDTITILAKILVYLLYYVVTLLPVLLLFSSLFLITLLHYCRRCYYFLRYITDTVLTSLVVMVLNSVHG